MAIMGANNLYPGQKYIGDTPSSGNQFFGFGSEQAAWRAGVYPANHPSNPRREAQYGPAGVRGGEAPSGPTRKDLAPTGQRPPPAGMPPGFTGPPPGVSSGAAMTPYWNPSTGETWTAPSTGYAPGPGWQPGTPTQPGQPFGGPSEGRMGIGPGPAVDPYGADAGAGGQQQYFTEADVLRELGYPAGGANINQQYAGGANINQQYPGAVMETPLAPITPQGEFHEADVFAPGSEFTSPFQLTEEQLRDDPGYQFRREEGLNALQAHAAARGYTTSGREMREISRYITGLAGQEYGAAYGRGASDLMRRYGVSGDIYSARQAERGTRFNRLASIAGAGQAAAGAITGMGTATGSALANLYSGQGANLANLYAGTGGALANIYGGAGQQAAGATLGTAAGIAGTIQGGLSSWNNYRQAQNEQNFLQMIAANRANQAVPGATTAPQSGLYYDPRRPPGALGGRL